MKARVIHLILVLHAGLSFSALAVSGPPVPREFTLQGLASGYSSPVQIDVEFQDAGGAYLWSETHGSVSLTSDGVFSINVGSQTIGGIPDTAFVAAEVWVELTFDTTDVWPRTRLLSVPFAIKSIYAENLVEPDSMEAALTVDTDGSVRAVNRILSPIYASTSPFVMEAPAGTERARIDDTTGNFGIGTSAPAHKLHVVTSSTAGRAVAGISTATSGLCYGGYFETAGTGTRAVAGFANATTGTSSGVYGYTASETDGRGVRGVAGAASQSGTSTGVWGESSNSNGYGVKGLALATSGDNYGVYGRSDSWSGTGVYGETTYDDTGTTYGVHGVSSSKSGRGVYGEATHTGGWFNSGVYGTSAGEYGRGVSGYATADTGLTHGVYGRSDSSSGVGVYGDGGSASGSCHGVKGATLSSSGYGVYGSNSDGGVGVYGQTNGTTGDGVVGHATAASSGFSTGVWGWNDGSDGSRGVLGSCENSFGENYGVYGYSQSSSGVGVFGFATRTSGTLYGVYGITNSSTDWGGYFDRLHASFASATVKAFQIDHPLDPENKYLQHSSVESPDMMNLYNGNVVADADGQAWVELPDYFEALNRDFRYQVSAIGAPMPDLYVAEEVVGNRFKIAGAAPGGKVSWQLTGIRHDPVANLMRVEVESVKSPEDRGKYLVPEAYELPETLGVHYRPVPADVAERIKTRESS